MGLRTILIALLMMFTLSVVFVTVVTAQAATSFGRLPQVALVGGDLTAEAAEISAKVKEAFVRNGVPITELAAEELIQAGALDDVDLLVWAGATSYPAEAATHIVRYLERGGHLLALGAPVFSRPVWQLGGVWRSADELEDELKVLVPDQVVFDFSDELQRVGWRRATNDFSSPGTVEVVEIDGNPVLHVSIGNLTGWDTWEREVPGLGTDASVFSLRAKGVPETRQISVELQEADGSRWIAVVHIGPEWDTYLLRPPAFAYWNDNPSKGRGGPGDHVRFSQVRIVKVGLALSHTQVMPGAHEFWLDDIGVTPDPFALLGEPSLPALDGLYPEYKYYPLRNPRIGLSPHQPWIKGAGVGGAEAGTIASVHPRPFGTGFLKGRTQRFIPLIETYDESDRRSGYLAWLTLHGSFGQSRYAGGAWGVFAPTKPEQYTEALVESIVDVGQAMLRGVYLLEGGSNQFAAFDDVDRLQLGAQVMHLTRAQGIGDLRVTWTVRRASDGEVVFHERQTMAESRRLQGFGVSYLFNSTEWRPGDHLRDARYIITTELWHEGEAIDRLEHELNVWSPKAEADREYVTVQDGRFHLGGRPWFAYGVNYMPSSGIALEDSDVFEYFLSHASYDPVVVEEDLERIASLGFNMISVFLYHRDVNSFNLLDLLVRAERHGLKVNLSLRPHADPLHFRPDEVTEMITRYRLDENDTVMAYDIAWERSWGTYEPSYGNVLGRKAYDAEWERWIVDHYGSIAAAEADWGVPVPRTVAGIVTGPSDAQLDEDGPWRVMVAAYRRFVDDFVGKKHMEAAEHIRSLDPWHLVSFRMGGDSGNPTAPGRVFGYDFKGLAPSMDIMQPEGYGRIGGLEQVKPGMFTATYSRYAAPGRPVLWAEMGVHVWSGSNFAPNQESLAFQAEFYRQFFEMVRLSQADGVVAWWFPGGYRFNERSDYGILAPDYSDRPVTKVIREYAQVFGEPGPVPPVDYWITVDRDADSRGLFGMYARVQAEYWKAVEQGLTPGLTDAGVATSSIDTPLVAVGNRPYNGSNPPKYLNAMFKRFEVKVGDGPWQDVASGETVPVPEKTPVYIRAIVTNTDVATWIAPITAAGDAPSTGTVFLAAVHDGDDSPVSFKAPISRDVSYLGDATIDQALLLAEVTESISVTLRMTAWNRMWFGEAMRLKFAPR